MNIDETLSKTIQVVSLITGLSVSVSAPREGWYKNSSDLIFFFPEVKKDVTLTLSDGFLQSDSCAGMLPTLLMQRMKQEGIIS